jgi:UDP-2,3-diacylglucosamine pyrophosphatase LpxH
MPGCCWHGNFLSGKATERFFLILVFMSTQVLNTKAQQAGIPIEKSTNREIAFVSDTQTPIWVESVFLRNNHNARATGIIFNEIIRKQPRALFILGDVVSLGYSNRKWTVVDRYLSTVRDKGTPVYALLGNHELMGRPKRGEANFQERFPEHQRTGYMQIVDSVGIIMLNSNFSSLSKAEIETQQQWLKSTLDSFEANNEVKAVIMSCHHSPYTNSKLVNSNVQVQEQFVKEFLKYGKCRLFISGHCHAFEYFKMEGKDFLVIGGGGGLQHPLYHNGEKYIEDLSEQYKPLFHYVTVRRDDNELHVFSHNLKDDFSGFDQGFDLKIPLK